MEFYLKTSPCPLQKGNYPLEPEAGTIGVFIRTLKNLSILDSKAYFFGL